MPKLGVMFVGVGGAVATTVVAGVELMLQGAVPKVGMLTEKTPANATRLPQLLDLAALDDLVFAGWDLRSDDLFAAALEHKVLTPETLRLVEPSLRRIRPWRAVFCSE